MCSLQVLTPNNINELVNALQQTTSNSKILSGGTDLVISLHRGEISPDLIIDITGINELRYIKEENGNVLIGALTTFTEIAKNELIAANAPCLTQVAKSFGSEQIRNRATVGGNIGKASPASDSLPALLALDAKVSIINSQGQIENLPIEEVLVGPGKTILKHHQAVIGVNFPVYDSQWLSTFVKLGTRAAVTIARINLAVNVKYDAPTNTITEAKVALGAVGKTAFRVENVEKLLKQQKVSIKLRDEFANELSAAVQESIPGRASLPYKKEAVIGVAYKAFENLFSI